MRIQNAKNLKMYIINFLSNIKNNTGGKLIDIAIAHKLINIVVNVLSSNSFIEKLIFLKSNVSKKYDKLIFELITKLKIKNK